MTFKEAKEYFYNYNGYSFHMFHDDYKKYYEYKMLEIDKKIEEVWRLDLLDIIYNKTFSNNNSWYALIDFINIMRSTNTNVNENAKRFLALLDYYAEHFDESKRLIMMNEMAGTNYQLQNSNITYLRQRTQISKKELISAMRKLCDFDPSVIPQDDSHIDYKKDYVRIMNNLDQVMYVGWRGNDTILEIITQMFKRRHRK